MTNKTLIGSSISLSVSHDPKYAKFRTLYYYWYWLGESNQKGFYEITDSPKPTKDKTGYYSSDFVCASHNVPNLFKLHGL